MGNLNRKPNVYLLNSVASTDVAATADTVTGRKVFIHKGLGLAIVGNLSGEANPRIHVNVLPGVAGTKKVSTLKLVKNFNTNMVAEDFVITIVRKARRDGFTDHIHDIKHTYNYEKKSFASTSNGAFVAADVADILSKLAARINADVALGDNQVSTGACVTATYVAAVTTPGSEVPAYIKLQSKNVKDIFEIEVDSDQFQIDDTTNIAGVTTAPVAPFGLYEDVARIFHIRADQAGTAPVVPIPGTLYGCVRIKERSEGYDNVVASGFNTREQLTEIWVPNSYIDNLADDLVAKLKEASLTIYKNSVAWA